MDGRKKQMKANRRSRAQSGGFDSDGTMQLLSVLRVDWAALRIQGCFRNHLKFIGFWEKKAAALLNAVNSNTFASKYM